MTVDKDMLLHWWYYYGKKVYTWNELETFENIIDKYGEEKVLDAAVASFINQDGSPTTILLSIRENEVDKLFESLPNISDMDYQTQAEYEKIRTSFIEKISKTM